MGLFITLDAIGKPSGFWTCVASTGLGNIFRGCSWLLGLTLLRERAIGTDSGSGTVVG